MALQNQEIAARIRELRGTRPQTLVADEMGVSERTLQNWEAGDAKPSYRSLQLIAKYYEVSEEFILTGGRRGLNRPNVSRETPDLSKPMSVDRLEGDLAQRISAIEDALAYIVTRLDEARNEQDRLNAMLERQDVILEQIQSAITRADAAAGRLDKAVARAGRALRAGTPGPPPTAAKPAQTRNRPASKPARP